MSQVTVVNNTPLPIPVQIRAREVSKGEARLHRLSHYLKAPNIAYNAISKQQGTAYDLAALDDVVKNASVLGIATIASLSQANKPGQAVPIWLGALGWLAAMHILPAFLSAISRLKTGVGLDIPYRSSQNDIRNLMENPNYMPTQVVPKSKQIELMRRYDIPLNAPNKDELLQQKLKQISIQNSTWWMLTAGPGTPLIASILSDRLEMPLLNAMTSRRIQTIENTLIAPALQNNNKQQLERGIRALAHIKLDGKPWTTQMSLWWQRLPQGVLEALDLQNPQTLKHLSALSPNEEERYNKLAEHLMRRLRPLKVREQLESYLRKQLNEVNGILDPFIKLLRDTRTIGLLKPTDRYEILQQARLTRGRSHATLGHMMGLLDIYEKYERSGPQVLKAHLKQFMEKSTLGYVEQLMRDGQLQRTRQLTGKYFTHILELTRESRYLAAQHLMGESPRSFLLRNTQSLAKRQSWLRYFPVAVGSTLMIGTALFMGTVLGENWVLPKAKNDPVEGGPIE
jgi:hypothetical protein